MLVVVAVMASGCISSPAKHQTGSGSSGGGADASSASGPPALPEFGAPCTEDLQCADGLVCSSERTGTLLTNYMPRPLCVATCGDLDSVCGPGSRGICLDDHEPETPGYCLRFCDATTEAGRCPEGTECELRFNQPVGFCKTTCIDSGDCSKNEVGFGHCHADGSCLPNEGEDNPASACTPTSQCICYPGGDVGTCAIGCRTDADCPVQTETGIQMICAGPSDAAIPSYSFCSVPCSTTADCGPLNLECTTDALAGTKKVCDTSP